MAKENPNEMVQIQPKKKVKAENVARGGTQVATVSRRAFERHFSEHYEIVERDKARETAAKEAAAQGEPA